MADETPSEDGRGPQRTPPYTSFKTLLTFVEDQKEHGLPTHIDRSVLTRFSGSVGGQVIAGLKFLGLIDANQSVQPTLQVLVDAHGTENWKGALAGLIERAYAPLVAEDLARMTPAKFHELFKTHYHGKDAVIRKCEVFFLKAAEAAGIPVNPRIAKHRAPQQSNGKKQSAKSAGSAKQSNGNGKNDDPPPPDEASSKLPSEVLLALLDPKEMEESEQDAVWTLLKYFRSRGQ